MSIHAANAALVVVQIYLWSPFIIVNIVNIAALAFSLFRRHQATIGLRYHEGGRS